MKIGPKPIRGRDNRGHRQLEHTTAIIITLSDEVGLRPGVGRHSTFMSAVLLINEIQMASVEHCYRRVVLLIVSSVSGYYAASRATRGIEP